MTECNKTLDVTEGWFDAKMDLTLNETQAVIHDDLPEVTSPKEGPIVECNKTLDVTEGWFDAKVDLTLNETQAVFHDDLPEVTSPKEGPIVEPELPMEATSGCELEKGVYVHVQGLASTVCEVPAKNSIEIATDLLKPTETAPFISQKTVNLASLDKLMKKLTDLHPETNRKRIVEALAAVRAKNNGFLTGLTHDIIVERASSVLLKATAVSQAH